MISFSWKTVRSVRWIIEICRTTWTKEAPPQPCPAEHHELPFVVSRPSWAKMSSWKRSWRPCLSSSKRSLGSQCCSSCRVYSLTNKAGHIVGSHRQKGPYGGTTWGGEASGVEKRVTWCNTDDKEETTGFDIYLCSLGVGAKAQTELAVFVFSFKGNGEFPPVLVSKWRRLSTDHWSNASCLLGVLGLFGFVLKCIGSGLK